MKTLKQYQMVALVVMVSLLAMNFQCDKYKKTGELASDFASGVASFQKVEIGFHNEGKVSDEEHQAIQRALIGVATAGKSMDASINQYHDAKSATAQLKAAIDGMSNLKGALGVKNPDTAAALDALFLTLKTTLDNIQALAG